MLTYTISARDIGVLKLFATPQISGEKNQECWSEYIGLRIIV